MSAINVSDLQLDHKLWLRDIERWGSSLRIWQNRALDLVLEYRRLLRSVEEHADDLTEFADSLDSLRNKVVADERAMVQCGFGKELSPDLCERHSASTATHDQLCKTHERLQQVQHTLIAGLALLKHEPDRMNDD